MITCIEEFRGRDASLNKVLIISALILYFIRGILISVHFQDGEDLGLSHAT